MILVDSSVWIDHFKKGSKELSEALLNEEIFSHPMIIGELSLGHYKNRIEILDLLASLPSVIQASDAEVLRLVDRSKLFGKGLGWIDVHLIASCLLSRYSLWTFEQALMRESKRLKIPILSL